jgi:tetratricopeptide (TPR) repeat protein
MGNYYLALNRPQDAIDYYNSAVSKSFYTCYKLSLAYTRLGNKKEAEKYSFLSFRMNPYFEPNLVQLGEQARAK